MTKRPPTHPFPQCPRTTRPFTRILLYPNEHGTGSPKSSCTSPSSIPLHRSLPSWPDSTTPRLRRSRCVGPLGPTKPVFRDRREDSDPWCDFSLLSHGKNSPLGGRGTSGLRLGGPYRHFSVSLLRLQGTGKGWTSNKSNDATMSEPPDPKSK